MTTVLPELERALRVAAQSLQDHPPRSRVRSLPRLRGRRVVLAIAIFLSVPAGAFAIAELTSGDSKPPTIAEESAPKGWTTVGRGDDPNFGPYEIKRSLVGAGECVGIRLRREEPPGTGPAGNIAHFCGEKPAYDAAFILGRNGTLAYGQVREEASSVALIDDGGREIARVPLTKTEDGVYFVVSTGERIQQPSVDIDE